MANSEKCKAVLPPPAARITVTMPQALRQRIEREARRERRSLAAQAVVLIERALAHPEKESAAA